MAAAAEIGLPTSFGFDRNGNLYFADTYNFVIREVTTDKRISTAATITDTSASTIDLAVDSSGTLFYVTGTTGVFKLVAASGVKVANLTDQNTADYLAVDPASGVMYVSSISTQRVFKIDGSAPTLFAGAYPLSLDGLQKPALSVRLQLNSILACIAVDSSGNVYFPELDNNMTQRIDKLSASGSLSGIPAPSNISFDAVAVGPDGLLYFSSVGQVFGWKRTGLLP